LSLSTRNIRRTATLTVGLCVAGALAAFAAPIERIDTAATATATARRIFPPAVDVVSVSNVGSLTTTNRDRALAAASAAGVPAVEGRGYSLGMTRVLRGTTVVQRASGTSGLAQFPMSVTALPPEALAATMGVDVSSTVVAGNVVMAQSSADLRGARAGDVIELVSVSGGVRSYTIGLVAADSVVGGTEIVISTAQATQLGATDSTRVLIYGISNRQGIEDALAARGLTTDRNVRVSRSWDPRSPDSTLSLLRTKQRLGEFAFSVSSSGSVSIDPAWTSANLPAQATLYSSVGVRARCHNAIIADLAAAFNDIAARGLAGEIDLANTNTYGGCFNPRFNRVAGNLGNLSRHTWAQAIDMNTVENCIGCTPKWDCRLVRIFRAHNFAWGGNFLARDGMHFEWVGEPRHTLQFPSTYCPNLPSGGIEQGPAPTGEAGSQVVITNRSEFFGEDGWNEVPHD
jgi:hypothetical protein